MTDETFTIEPITEDKIDALASALDSVARERRYLAPVEGLPVESLRKFIKGVINGNGISLIAMHEGNLIGWCDVVRRPFEGYQHSARLGMGVVAAYRGKGIGRRLLESAIGTARDIGITRIELEVFASNAVARALYERAGFVEEGIKRNARIIDGGTDDSICMALLL